MEVIYLLIGVSFVVAAGFLAAFIWAIRSDQYKDDVTPSIRMLLDESSQEKTNKQQ